MRIDHWDMMRQRINQRQDELKLSNYSIAKEIGVSQSTVGRIRSGECVPSAEVLLKYLKAIQLQTIIKNI